jgi:Ca2+-binding RTX toxin-like protein
MTRLGADPLPGDGGWRVEDGAAGLLIEARWETPETAPVRTRIVVADATAAQPPRILEESDYAAHGITLIDALGGASGRAVWIAEPLAGDYAYDLELVTETAIGVVTRSAAVTRTPMRFDTITATLDADALRIDYGAVTGESSGAMLRFFVDDDGTGFDGRPVGGPVPVDPGGRVTLAMPPLAAGRYWLYGVLSEEGSAPFLDYAPSPVTVRTSGVLPPELAISPVAAELPEGDDGVTRFAFRVTRSGDLTGESTLRWTVDPDDANASDFVGTGLPSGLLGFAVGQVEATITVEVAGDTTPESDERFAVTLSDPTDARVTTATAQATIRNDDLPPAVVLTGTAASEVLQGGPDDETLIGGGGNDTLIGGAGNDTLVVDSVSDVVVELAGGGIDTVVSGVTRTLGEHQENLVLTGAANLDGTGNALANRIIGNAGNNVLRGLFGADTLEGGAGHDTYVLDSAQDVVIERDGEGTDTVMAPVAWTLGPNLENLVLTGPASVAGTGNALANRIDGNTGDNTLTGGGGADTLAGGTGDDTHVVDSADDLVIELAGGGTDTVRASVTRTLGDQQEHLTLTGDRAIDGIGNALTNRIEGNTAANTLTGLAGADTLLGGDGADVFRFVARGDSTLGAVDTILDFGAGDRLVLEGSAGLARATDSVTWAGSPGATISAIRARTGLADRIVTFDDGVDTFVYVNGAGSGVSFDGTLVRLTGRTATPTVDGIVPPPARDLSRTGTDAAETLQGGDGDDTLTGLGGNDTLEGLAGDDRLDGGDGIDWAVFSGALSGYTLRGDGAHVEVTDLAPDREGTDTVTSIERLQFADLGVNLTIQAAAASIDPAALDRIAELYVGFFGRVPAADGLENWILQHRAGRTLSAIADDFHAIGTSPALRERTGYWDLDADAPLSDAGYVALIYRNVLGREGKAGGIAYWSAQLRPGDDGAPAAETRGSLVGTMLDAAHALKGDETWGWVAELLEDRVAMSKRIAVEWGLNYGATPEAAITLGAAIAGAVDESPNPDPAFADSPVKTFDFDAAIAIIGVDPARIDLI